ncbi:RNase III domain-containing protein [Mycena sanguinolenta]|uniref:RNase III domain-containing protein n=1 Tax=Mycena sanguinolenta TaxID=230812 RepID=A0A8H6YRM6_9AGAR|nr:RNase III domain-containing protein [Mycena sanguinolenta]
MSCQTFVRNRIVSTITAETYRPQLLTLSEKAWDSISDDSDTSASENRRMEWLGDKIIAWRISLKLYEIFSEGDVEFYHVSEDKAGFAATDHRQIVRESLVCNLTFTHLMQKIGAATATSCPSNKTSADVFEALVAVLYNEHAKNHLEDKFHAWFDDMFVPLIEAGYVAYHTYKRQLNLNNTRAARFKTRKRLGHKAGAPCHFTPIPFHPTVDPVLKALRSSRYRFRTAEKHKYEHLRKLYPTINIPQAHCIAPVYHTTFTPIIRPEPFGLDSRTFNRDDENLDEYHYSEDNEDASGDNREHLDAYEEDEEYLNAPNDEEENLDAYEEAEDLDAPEDDEGYLDPSEDNQKNLNAFEDAQSMYSSLFPSSRISYLQAPKLVVPPPVTFWPKFEFNRTSRTFSTVS